MARRKKKDELMPNDSYEYIRVGTTIYVPSIKPMLSKRNEKILLPWNIETIKHDHPNYWRAVVRDMHRYKGFCTMQRLPL